MEARPLRSGAAVVFVTALTLTLVSCASPVSGGSTATPDDTVVVAFGGIDSLDPVFADQSQNQWPNNALYDSVVAYNAAGEMIPRLAESWTLSEDAMEITLQLRDDVTFSDGTPLTAADVVYSLDRVKRLGTGVASLLADYASSTATEDHTVTITLTRPNAIFLGGLSKVYILNSALVTENAGSDDAQTWLASNAAGSGAYTLTDFNQGADISLTERADYFEAEEGRPETIVLRAVSDETSGRNALLAGELDAFSMTPAAADVFRDDDAYEAYEILDPSQMYFFMNTQNPKLSDPRVREAIALAFDYEGQIANLGGYAEQATGILPWNVACHATTGIQGQDVDRAAELLAEAGATGLEVTVQYQTWSEASVSAATLLESNLADIGVDTTLETITYEAYVASLATVETTPDIIILNDFALYPDAGTLLDRTYSSRTIGAGSNYGNYANPEVDELISAAMAEPDEAARCDLYTQIQQIVGEDVVSVNVAAGEYTFVTSAGISGYGNGDSADLIDLREIRVD